MTPLSIQSSQMHRPEKNCAQWGRRKGGKERGEGRESYFKGIDLHFPKIKGILKMSYST